MPKNSIIQNTIASSKLTIMENPDGKFLADKIKKKSAIVAVIGMGYVGFPLASAIKKAGYSIIGFDIDVKKIKHLNNGTPYLSHFDKTLFKELAESEKFNATSQYSDLSNADIVLICVPTPLGNHNEPDLSYVLNATRSLSPYLKKSQLIILESTTYPGTTKNEMAPILTDAAKEKNLFLGEDFFLAYSPEREDPGNTTHSTSSIPKLVGGINTISGDLAELFYNNFVKKVYKVSSAEVAESAKLLENIYRAVNIALVNETKVILEKLNIDIWEVIDAAATKPFGFEKFTPGPGLGGHCIPIDPFYLAWQARAAGKTTRFIELAGEINREMPSYVVNKLSEALNSQKKPISDSKILIIGVAYKPNIDDCRESAAAEIMKQLQEANANIKYHDPYVKKFQEISQYPTLDNLNLESTDLNEKILQESDAVIIITDHNNIDWLKIARHARLIIDTRNAIMENCAEEGVTAILEKRLIKA